MKELKKEVKFGIETCPSTQKTIPKVDKEYYCDIQNMNSYIKDAYPTFGEQFELIEFINSGSNGYVYSGRNKNSKDNTKFAFKFCIKNKNKENESKRKESDQYQEVHYIKKLHHKYINQMYAFIKMNDTSFFSILELSKHGDLDNFMNNLLKRKTLPETCVNYFAKQILEGLSFIHYRFKIIHMDIKPGNILIDTDLSIKIIDFSVSCSYSEFDPDDLVKFPFIGTGRFIAPEVINRAHMKIRDAPKIDIYSFGVTLYYIAFGKYPYGLDGIKSKNYEEILNKIKSEELTFPKEGKFSPLFKDFLTKVLEKDYKKRITIREALEHPWIQAWKALDDEKSNSSCLENFLIKLITDNVYEFNESVKLK